MKWNMEIEEIEAILEKIWDLHDKLSDAIHSISRSHFLSSVKSLKNSHNIRTCNLSASAAAADDSATAEDRVGFVFVKDFRPEDDDSALHEAKSLNAIRTALENLEDQLEFLHTIQTQQRVERDAAIARLEQSRIVLAMRLAEHHGKKYEVIEEAQAFVGDVHDAGRFVSPKILCGQPNCSENFVTEKRKNSNFFYNVFVSSFNFVKKSFGLDHMGGIVGNAALVAVSMIALLHLHQISYHDHPFRHEDGVHSNRTFRTTTEGSSSESSSCNLDVLLARG
ncbi:plastid division protein PDV1 [Arachis duranensis]|uniref:Plastid division protein PDV1 n=1 Tax=Arachis duranensis TaxID=130453 RepID=A0A6P4DSR9_ARADU|nr:plastid division protein PDV1 [Arachis duranensis]